MTALRHQAVPAREPAASPLRVNPCVMGHSGCGQCCSSHSRHALSPASLVVAVSRSMISSNTEIHGVIYRHIGNLILGYEFMHWISHWHRGESQEVNFTGIDANYLW